MRRSCSQAIVTMELDWTGMKEHHSLGLGSDPSRTFASVFKIQRDIKVSVVQQQLFAYMLATVIMSRYQLIPACRSCFLLSWFLRGGQRSRVLVSPVPQSQTPDLQPSLGTNSQLLPALYLLRGC